MTRTARRIADTSVGNRGSQDEVVGHDGRRVDVTGDIWRVGPEHTINWSQLPPSLGRQVVVAIDAHIRHLIRTQSSPSVSARFDSIKLFFNVAHELKVDLSSAVTLNAALLNRLRIALNAKYALATVVGALHGYRLWYVWSTDADLPGFDFDVATKLESLTIGGGPKGEAVLRNDPKRGPLHSTEFDRLYQSMRKATETDALS